MNTLGDPSVFWFLRLLLFSILIICGFFISKGDDKTFKRCLWFAIIAYALVEGLRWMRGTDYDSYLGMFRTGECEKPEPVFLLLVNIVHSLSIDPTAAFVFLSGMMMGCLGLVFKNFKTAAVWGLPLIYLMLGYNAENLVRQYMAISCLGVAYYFYYLDKRILMLLFLILAPCIHFTSLLGSAVFFLFAWKDFKPLNVWWFVGMYIAAYFLWNPEWLDPLGVILSTLNVDDSSAFSIYVINAENHFTEAGSLSLRDGLEIHRSIINIVLYFLTDLAIIIAGYHTCKNNQKYLLLYYFSIIGLLCQQLFGDIQVLMRFGYYFSWMLPILISIIAVSKDYGKQSFWRVVVLSLFFVRYAFYGVIDQIGKITMEEGCMFIWDK